MSQVDKVNQKPTKEASPAAAAGATKNEPSPPVAEYYEQPNKMKNALWTTRAPATFDKVALVSAFLGILIGYGLRMSSTAPSIGVYMIANGCFHLLEFWVTSKFNESSLGMWSFCLLNGPPYAIAQVFSALEILFWHKRSGHWPYANWCFKIGVLIVFVGQTVRTLAMIQAATSFNHFIQKEKKSNHTLVVSGLYGIVRHPSYTGFALWTLGLQLVVGNYISFLLFSAVVFQFFKMRIAVEERHLLKFFGDEYKAYKQRVPSGIPFVK